MIISAKLMASIKDAEEYNVTSFKRKCKSQVFHFYLFILIRNTSSGASLGPRFTLKVTYDAVLTANRET